MCSGSHRTIRYQRQPITWDCGRCEFKTTNYLSYLRHRKACTIPRVQLCQIGLSNANDSPYQPFNTTHHKRSHQSSFEDSPDTNPPKRTYLDCELQPDEATDAATLQIGCGQSAFVAGDQHCAAVGSEQQHVHDDRNDSVDASPTTTPTSPEQLLFPTLPKPHELHEIRVSRGVVPSDSLYSDSDVDANEEDSCPSRDQNDEWDPGFRGDYELSKEVFSFFKNFGDFFKPLYTSERRPDDERRSFPDEYKGIAHMCILERLSQGQIQKYYDVAKLGISGLLSQHNGIQSDLMRHYPKAELFAERIMTERKVLIKEQEWVSAHIVIKEEEQVGYFIPLVTAVDRIISEHGGIRKLVRFSEKFNSQGQRVYFHPVNCNGMRKDQHHINKSLLPVYISLYIDGTLVANCGSTECCVVRMRVDNLLNASHIWTDVGIAPLLLLKDSSPSASELPDLRLELFQRFFFLLLESASHRSETNFRELGFQVRFLSLITDRQQERTTLSLFKAAGSERICSICRAKRKNVTTEGHEPRSVLKTVPAQLELAVIARLKRGNREEVLLPSIGWKIFEHVRPPLLRGRVSYLKTFLKQESAKAFPPALAVLPGIGTPSYRLYELPGFDLLHVMDLGTIRLFADSLHEIFSLSRVRGKYSKASFIRTINKRILESFLCTCLSSTAPVKNTADERQASFTGKQWRMLPPLLPIGVLGLNRSCTPDEDIILQTALGLDFQQAILKGTNRGGEFLYLTDEYIQEIQTFSRNVGDLMTHLFRCVQTSKLHRMSSHIGENFKNFGPTAFTDTGINESLHRGIKLAYMATNKKKTGLGQQILQVNLPADLLCSSSIRSFARKNRIFMTTTRELSAEEVEALRPMDCNELHKQNMAAALAQRYVLQMQERNPGCSIEEQFESLESAKSGIYSRVFDIYKTATIAARLPWIEHKVVTVKQIIYGSDALESWGSRHDGVLYEESAGNIQTREYQEAFKSVGIVQDSCAFEKILPTPLLLSSCVPYKRLQPSRETRRW